MPRRNWNIIRMDVAEALGELQELHDKIKAKNYPSAVQFQAAMQHACFHLNFAWNARHEKSARYANLTEEDFESWGQFPKDLQWGD